MAKMNAIVLNKKNKSEILRLEEVDKPIPKNNEVLVKVRATTLNSGDLARITLGLLRKNTITGSEFAGDVVEVGKDVKRFKKGDKVFGYRSSRAHAQFVSVRENSILVQQPNNITYQEAAAVPNGALSALYFLKKGKIKQGQKVLINGASGSVGSYAVQLAKHCGAHVTGVCSTKNVELVEMLGADQVIDYTKEDFTDGNNTYDLIFDTVGNLPFNRSNKVLNKRGAFASTALNFSLVKLLLWSKITGSQRVVIGMAKQTTIDMNYLKDLMESQKLRPVIDGRSTDLLQINNVFNMLKNGSKTGNFVLTVA